ncbi:MAG: cyclopropane-fatty-acyl-phospholipid synthase family protein [Pseudomonadota bacterium]
MILTSTSGQSGLPRYFARVFDQIDSLKKGRVDIVLPDGRRFRAEGPEPGFVAEVAVHNDDLFTRVIREGDVGFAEAYMEGWWTTPDLQAVMDFMHDDADHIYNGFPAQRLAQLFERFRFWMQGNSKKQARKNISHHYDLGNNFYKLWLDDTMTYSSAIFDTGQESTEAAQTAKYASMIDQMGAQAGDHVLEIGCGWGGFAEYAAKERGIKVTGLTISREQHDFAVARMARLGLSDMVDIKMQDYRDEKGTYDGIASIEMFEAVGEKYWPTYFSTVRERLKPGKNATLQIITLKEENWEAYRKGVDFIQKYIFPGGMLPAPSVLRQNIENAGLNVAGSIEFGKSYGLTLRRWHDSFNEKWDQVAAMGFDDRFKRMWDYYLTSCAASFDSRNCDVTQITVTRAS